MKRDKLAFQYFNSQKRYNKVSQLNLSVVLFVICRSFWRKNSTTYTLNQSEMHSHIWKKIDKIKSWKKNDKKEFRKRLHSIRAQLRYIWIPLLCCANKISSIDSILPRNK
eukprot:103233_1